MQQLSLKKKIILSTSVLGGIMMLIFSLFVFFYLKDFMINQKIREINQLNVEQGHESAQIFAKHQLFSKMLGTRTRVKEYLLERSEAKAEELNNIFLEYTQADPRYLAIYLLDEKGQGLISTDQRFVGEDYSFRDYFKQAIKGQAWTEILLGKTSKQFGYYFSYPITDGQAKIIGVLVVKVSTAEIEQAIVASEISKNSTIMLTDQYGVIVYSNRNDRFLKSLGTLLATEMATITENDKFLGQKIESLQYELVQTELRSYNKPVTLKFNDQVDSDQEIIGLVKLENLPFYLVTETSLDAIEGTIFSTIIFLLVVTFLILVLSVFVLLRLFNIFISPLAKLKVFAQAISAGNFSEQIELKSNDEFNDLARVFNKMAKDLSYLYQNLDKKVAQQTKEVTSKAKALEDQQIATLNILEDIEKEKEISQQLAKDLEKFQLAVANASDHVVITDEEGFIIYANKSVERITGFTSEEVLGKKAGSKELWGGLMDPAFYKLFWNTVKIKKQVFTGELKNHRKNGEVYEAMSSVSPVLSDQGEVLYFVGIERDISREKQIDRAKTEFVSLASHQLRTPLSAISWYAEMLLHGDAGKLKSEQVEYVKEIFDGNQRMIDLVNALLNVSRIELGTLAVDSVPTDLRELADSVLSELKPQLIQKKHKVITNYDKKLPKINLDSKIMRVVWQNFLSNAVKYTPEKGQITVGINIKGKDALISVADTGYGIPKNQQDKIFTKLFRADNIRDKVTDGTGLGLYIIKSVIEQFGGKVWFESVESKGTTFYASIPLKGVAKKEGSKGLNYNK